MRSCCASCSSTRTAPWSRQKILSLEADVYAKSCQISLKDPNQATFQLQLIAPDPALYSPTLLTTGQIARQARGFIYAISRAGVTGARAELTDDAKTLVARVRKVTDLPIAVGFGVSTPQPGYVFSNQVPPTFAFFSTTV